MFKLEKNSSFYFWYTPAMSGPKYFKYTGSETLMWPSGPKGLKSSDPRKADYADFKEFLEKTPGLQTENACPPFSITLCSSVSGALPPPPKVDAVCGTANGSDTYANFSAISADHACAYGDAKLVSQNSSTIKWNCVPPAVMGGGATDSCSAKVYVPPPPPPEPEPDPVQEGSTTP
jgi:hypothetical protein